MPDIEFTNFRNRRNRAHIIISQAMPRMHFQPKPMRQAIAEAFRNAPPRA